MAFAFRSPAKINPHLRVVGRRPDGFHELRVLFQTIDLHDRLEFTPAESGLSVSYADAASGRALDFGPTDLVSRAVAAFTERWGPGGEWAIRVEKSIPAGGGLGGGSSNAATALLAMRELVGRPDTARELEPVARQLGADVAFFLEGGFAAGTGRGDVLEILEDGPEEVLFLAVPAVSISTADAFGWLARTPPDRPPVADWPAVLERWQRAGRGGEALRRLGGENDLEAVVREKSSIVEAVYAALLHQGVEGVRMTGSGACCFGYPADPSARTPVLPEGLGTVLRVRTLPRRALAAFRGLV